MVNKLFVDAGKACVAFHDASVLDVKTKRVQVYEIWSFTYAKQKNVARAFAAPDGAGDTWTWKSIGTDSKVILSYFVGGRDGEYAIGLWMICVHALPDAFSSLATAIRHIWKLLRARLVAISTTSFCTRSMVKVLKA